jgi:hypothetical protein
MIAHPFEIKPSATNQGPDVLMVTWRGTSAQSVAEIYLPAVSSETIISLADKIYGRHRLTATDANTIQFPASDLALIPIPAGTGRYAGLLSVEVHPSMPEGRSFTVSVRQLNQASATTRTPPPPPPTPQVAVAKRSAGSKRAAVAKSKSESSNNETFAWRQVQGAFQYTVTVKSAGALLSEQERLVAWLKWRFGILPATNRWRPVLQRYLKYTEDLVWSLGKDPNTIPPSEVGKVIGEGLVPEFPIVVHEEYECTGKVVAIHYDRFGDFRGFVVLTDFGHERTFRATEHAMEELVREAWVERTELRVFSDEHDPERPDRLVLLRFH